jgi:Na+-driven multidrug efflux pump
MSICNQVPQGFSLAASSLIGAAIGEANIPKAKSYIKLIFFFASFVLISIQLLIHLFKTLLVDLFTADVKIAEFVL